MVAISFQPSLSLLRTFVPLPRRLAFPLRGRSTRIASFVPLSAPKENVPDNKTTTPKESQIRRWLRRIVYSSVVGTTLFGTTSGWLGLNKLAKWVGFAPTAQAGNQTHNKNLNNSVPNHTEYKIDTFFARQMGKELNEIMSELNISPKEVDLNNNKVLFDTPKEACRFRRLVKERSKEKEDKYTEFLSLLEETAILNKTIFYAKRTDQNGRMICYNARMTEGLQEHPEIAKEKISVESYKFNPKTKKIIDLVLIADVNGEKVRISLYEEGGFRDWMSAGSLDPSSCKDPLGMAITYAVDKVSGENHLLKEEFKTWRLPPGYAILATGKDYSFLPTYIQSDSQLIQILSKAKKSIITCGAMPNKKSLEGDCNGNLLDKLMDDELAKKSISPAKTNVFNNILDSSVKNAAAFLEDTSDEKPNNQKERISIDEIMANHIYRVTGFENIDGKDLVTIEDSTTICTLTLKQFRNKIDFLVPPNDILPPLPAHEYPLLFLNILFAGSLINRGSRKTVNAISRIPEHIRRAMKRREKARQAAARNQLVLQ